MSWIAYANGSNNDLGPADAGITVYRKDADGVHIREEREIVTWTGTEIDDEDGDLDTEAAERQLGYLGYLVTGAWSNACDGQQAVEVEPVPA